MRLLTIPVVLAALTFGCSEEPEAVQIDHIVLGISDLQAGIDQLEELTGVRPVFGGEHPDLGTHNALMSLGTRQYLEILAPRPEAEVVDRHRPLKELSDLTPVMWAVATDDAVQTAERLATNGHPTTEIVPGSRTLPDGSILEWKIFRLSEFGLAGVPFFIEWSEQSPHPSQTSPTGCEFESIELAHPKSDRLRQVVQILGLNLAVAQNESTMMKVRIRCPSGEIQLGG